MRGEALNPAHDFILHSAIFCLDHVSRHAWGDADAAGAAGVAIAAIANTAKRDRMRIPSSVLIS